MPDSTLGLFIADDPGDGELMVAILPSAARAVRPLTLADAAIPRPSAPRSGRSAAPPWRPRSAPGRHTTLRRLSPAADPTRPSGIRLPCRTGRAVAGFR